MKTIAYFTESAEFGGAEHALLHLIAGLDRQRWRPVLFHHAGEGLAPLLTVARELDVQLRAVPPMPLGKQGAARIPLFMRELRDIQPAVFHAHLTWPLACKYGILSAVLARIPAIVATEQLWIDLPYSRSTRLQLRLLATRVGAYIAVSQALANNLIRTFGVPSRKITVIRNAIPADRFTGHSEGHAAIDAPSHLPIVLTCARLDPQKGLCYLLEAAAHIPDALFVLAGDGPERASLETLAHDLGISRRVRFLGYRQDIPALLACCDLFVLPSLYEGLPLSILEAMAAGKPVVATAIGGTDEAVLHGTTGVLVPPADAAALAGAIQTILAHPVLARAMGTAGKQRVAQQFSVEHMVERTTSVYDWLLNKRAGA